MEEALVRADDTETSENESDTDHGRAPRIRPHLFLIVECQRPTARGARFDVGDVDEIVFSRGPERRVERATRGGVRQLDVRVPDRSLSSLHARIRSTTEGWSLEDAGSTNGSFIGGHRISKARVEEGDLVELGHTFFVLRPALVTPPGTPADIDLMGDSTAPALTTTIPSLAHDYEMIAQVARSAVPITLTGETGTGKELVSREIHRLSGRSGPFVAVNCGAIPESMMEATFFGHAKGAFTGAARDEPGVVRAADAGTLLLDEIGELHRTGQTALLRVLQEKEVLPIGSSRSVDVDVRFLAATLEPLRRLCDAAVFRSDLLARLDGFSYRLRPLRERIEDLGSCIASILTKHGANVRLTRNATRLLLQYDWPANVRELEQCLLRSLALAEAGTIRRRHLPGALLHPEAAPVKSAWSDEDARIRRELIELLSRHRGNVTEVAQAMGKARMQIQRWIRRLDIDVGSFRANH